MSDSQWYAREGRPSRHIGIWAAIGVFALVVLWWFWPTITRAVVAHDLRGFAAKIRESNLDVPVKIEVLDQIDDLQDELDKGRSIGLLQWRAASTAIDELLAGEAVVVPLVQRELRRAERRLR